MERGWPPELSQPSQTAPLYTRVSAEGSPAGHRKATTRCLDPIQPARHKPSATKPRPPAASNCQPGDAPSSATAPPAATSTSPATSLSARRMETSSARVGELRNDMSPVWIGRNLPPHDEIEQLGVRQVQQRCERLLFGGRGGRIPIPEVSFEQDVELAHAAPTAPAEPGAAQCRRSAIFFLISAIALAGFRSFGQASVQFMIVWQR